ncbi:MAG TPA: DUF4013 domain-containing protein [Methanocorpusculum sp.]|nr:DUF4013 domain-containing protein [Methanocorpusculum sp.]
MSIGIGDNLTGSFGFAKDKLGGNFVTWLILAVLNLVPIVNWIVFGTYVKVLRGNDPDLDNMGKSFVDGLLALIIGLIYMIVPIILMIIVSVGMFTIGSVATITPASSVVPDMAAGAGVALMFGLIILCIIVSILFSLLLIPALVNFARNGFGAAFSFGTIFGMISKAGWLNYIVSIILIWIIFGVIVLICTIIPIIGWIFLIFLMPFLYCWGAKYFANLFE